MTDTKVVLLPPDTVLQAGDPPPPTKSNKAIRAGFWAGVPIFIGAVITAFQQIGVFYPEAPDWVLRTAAYILMVAGPVLGYFGVQQATDQLQQPVKTIEGTSLDGRPVTLTVIAPAAPASTAAATESGSSGGRHSAPETAEPSGEG